MSDRGRALAPLARARAMCLVTFRRSGAPVGTVVWPVVLDATVYVVTPPGSGKLKRLRREPRVTMTPCTQWGRATGATWAGTARIVSGEEAARARRALRTRYRLVFSLLMLVNRLRRHGGEVVVAITPTGPDDTGSRGRVVV